MISYYGVKNFKSLLHVGIKTTNLNVFMGLNSMGKSSIIQSMLALRQSFIQMPFIPDKILHNLRAAPQLFFKGNLVSLGLPKDVYCQNAEDTKIEFFIAEEKRNWIFAYDYDYNKSSSLFLEGGYELKKEDSFGLPQLFSMVRYLSANHIGPQAIYEHQNADMSRFNELGNFGELAPLYLSDQGEDKIGNPSIHHKKSKINKPFT